MTYRIWVREELIFEGESESDFLDMIQDLSVSFYETGRPYPDDIKTSIGD